ncbi:hypothetical protein GGF41_000188 [Coemansia sp. RSA 2531]|nr:hypothetical protein GGF41_000188 [Coemansia sp. RSA 2531]
MSISDIETTKYTHIHYAFVMLDEDFKPYVKHAELGNWNEFVALKGSKKIVSFGGWAFSNEPGTYAIFTDSVSDANRQKFANNVVNFMNDYGLDGVDFDWEYPGATDIPGATGRGPNDGTNYLNFLRYMKSVMPVNKSLSMAAPASYWYLRNYPIKDMAPYLDYIVYMTYDLHGQWDYNIPSIGPQLRSLSVKQILTVLDLTVDSLGPK